MGDHIHKPIAIAAIVILILLALLVRARALFTFGTSRVAAPATGRRLNIGVDIVPLSGVRVQRPNHREEDTNGQTHHHLHRLDSVTSIRHPPPAYHIHHHDRRYDGVISGFGHVGHPVGSSVDLVPIPLPPPYTTHSGGDHFPR
ncbi:hypothetical protein FRC01_009913 [Tulasnella sp. 417]|nr:hypothetical protein FRC01_009913 [Tulasnella sp. 417]